MSYYNSYKKYKLKYLLIKGGNNCKCFSPPGDKKSCEICNSEDHIPLNKIIPSEDLCENTDCHTNCSYGCDLSYGKKDNKKHSDNCLTYPIHINFTSIQDFSDQIYELLKVFPMEYESDSDIDDNCSSKQSKNKYISNKNYKKNNEEINFNFLQVYVAESNFTEDKSGNINYSLLLIFCLKNMPLDQIYNSRSIEEVNNSWDYTRVHSECFETNSSYPSTDCEDLDLSCKNKNGDEIVDCFKTNMKDPRTKEKYSLVLNKNILSRDKVFFKCANNLADYVRKLKENIISKNTNRKLWNLIFSKNKPFFNHNQDVAYLHFKFNDGTLFDIPPSL